ncbi:MAG: L-histidine N(alpha)-methyltransferase [Pyrinomonadaceae bacterium]
MSQLTSDQSSDRRLDLHNLVRAGAQASFADDVRRGLSAEPKRLFPKYFYDELGSQLFEAICLLPEYYLTRAENEIFARYAGEIASAVKGHKTLLEMGSGSASKTRLIIEALLAQQNDLLYMPIDISAYALESSSRLLLQSYPSLRIEAYASDYYGGFVAIKGKERGRTLALFLGSNIGNFDADEAHTFLRALRGVLSEGDALLLGADLRKSKDVLEAAYDDSLGITAAFNLNLLVRINRELDADFNLRAFKHYVRYDEEIGRIEIYVESLSAQEITIGKLGINIRLEAGERIHTENSYKYDLEGLSKLATATGFTRTRTWLDEAERFSSNLFLAS